MEQQTLPFPETHEWFSVKVTCDDSDVDLPEKAPERFESHFDAMAYLVLVKELLEDSGYGIKTDMHANGWVGLQKQSDGAHVWRGFVVHHEDPIS